MDAALWIPLFSALGAGLGYGIPKGFNAFMESRNGKKSKKDTPITVAPPSPDSYYREQRKEAARAAGYGPGNTGKFDAINSLGQLRCDACPALQDLAHRTADGLEALQAAVASAASAASVASAASIRVEQAVHALGERTDKAIEKVGEKLALYGEWKGGADARLQALERQGVRRGGAAG